MLASLVFLSAGMILIFICERSMPLVAFPSLDYIYCNSPLTLSLGRETQISTALECCGSTHTLPYSIYIPPIPELHRN